MHPELPARLRAIRSFAVRGFPNHIIFYLKVHGGIEVLRVLHGARDLRRDLKQ